MGVQVGNPRIGSEAPPMSATNNHQEPTPLARYADLKDRRLALTLSREDLEEEHDRDPLERITCRTHRRWLHQCVSSPLHVIIVTGHRWCRSCSLALSVAVDELAGDVTFSCPGCGRAAPTRATRQLIRACRASLAAAHDDGLAYPGLSAPEPRAVS
ncbi:hypothetical protein CVV72_05120 [Amycolatopsis sp. TNS106]|nr:hypothetical protein CVV72_05120 [Amycolatopsis sp. TNS106]